MCLDTEEKIEFGWTDDKSSSAAYILHGRKLFTSNRWFDKTVQVKLFEFSIFNLVRVNKCLFLRS
jgi:hypothetical protein